MDNLLGGGIPGDHPLRSHSWQDWGNIMECQVLKPISQVQCKCPTHSVGPNFLTDLIEISHASPFPPNTAAVCAFYRREGEGLKIKTRNCVE